MQNETTRAGSTARAVIAEGTRLVTHILVAVPESGASPEEMRAPKKIPMTLPS